MPCPGGGFARLAAPEDGFIFSGLGIHAYIPERRLKLAKKTKEKR